MQQPNQRTNRRDTVLISGWVYADLLLGLMILFLVSTKGVDPVTLVPTMTPTPTATSTPTVSPSPTRTATRLPVLTSTPTGTLSPSSTPVPTDTPTPTATPTTVVVGVSKVAFETVLRVKQDLLPGFFANDAQALKAVDAHLTPQIRHCFESLSGKASAGIVLAFGANADAGRGNRLAAAATKILLREYPDLFRNALVYNYHELTTRPADIGTISLKIHFITAPGVFDAVGTCQIPQDLW